MGRSMDQLLRLEDFRIRVAAHDQEAPAAVNYNWLRQDYLYLQGLL